MKTFRIFILSFIMFVLMTGGIFDSKGTITGTVINSEGNPIENATVEAVPLDEGISQSSGVQTNKSGYFEFKDMEGGSYTLNVTESSYAPSSVPVSVNSGITGMFGCNDVETTIVLLTEEEQEQGQEGELVYVKSIGGSGANHGEFHFTSYEAIFHDGSYLYVTDNYNHRIQKFDGNGNFVSWFGTKDGSNYGFYTSTETPSSSFHPQYYVQVDGSGNLYVRKDDVLYKYNAGTGDFANVGIPVTYGNCTYLDSSGNIFAYKISMYNEIEKYDNSGTKLLEFGGYGSGDGKFRNDSYSNLGIVVDSQDNVYAVDRNNCNSVDWRIQKFDNDGSFILNWNVPYWNCGANCLAIDENDNIYHSDYCSGDYMSGHALKKYSTGGTLLKKYFIPGEYESIRSDSFCVQDNKVYWIHESEDCVIVFSIPE